MGLGWRDTRFEPYGTLKGDHSGTIGNYSGPAAVGVLVGGQPLLIRWGTRKETTVDSKETSVTLKGFGFGLEEPLLIPLAIL